MPIPTRKHSIAAALASSLLMLSACSGPSEAQEQKVSEASKHTSAALGVASGDYTMDKGHGYVTFSYSHKGLSNPQLRFNNVDAALTLDADTPVNSQIKVTIAAAQIDSGVDKFDAHLKSADFFNVDVHPKISFTSTRFTRASASAGTMTGDLSMMGITKPIHFDVTLIGTAKDAIGVEGRGTLLRSDFNLGKYVPHVGDEVSIAIFAEFHKNKE